MNNKQTGNAVRVLLEQLPCGEWLELVGRLKLEKDGSILAPQLMVFPADYRIRLVEDLKVVADYCRGPASKQVILEAATEIVKLRAMLEMVNRAACSKEEASDSQVEVQAKKRKKPATVKA